MNKLMRAALCVALALILPATLAAPVTALADFTARLNGATSGGDFVGLAVAVVEGGEIALLYTYGVRNVDGDEPITKDTVFRLASLSKGFAASAASLLVAEGRLAWDDKVIDTVVDFALKDPQQAALVTVEHLLSHRVGLPPYAYDNLLEANRSVDSIVKRLKNVDMICAAASCYGYQNVAFNMSADILHKASGMPFEQLLRERLFEPLQMNTASVGRDGLSATGNWARPHIRRRYGPWRSTTVSNAYYQVPAAGGVNASIHDMAKWLQAQMGARPELLPPQVLLAMHTPHVTSKAETRRLGMLRKRLRASHYGLGWRIYDYAGNSVINHTGGVRGYMAQIAFIPERDIGIVVLANAVPRRASRIVPAFLDSQLGLSDRDWLRE